MNRESNRAPPNGWGNDALTQYFDNFRNNQFATFANKRSEVIDLVTIDGLFCKLLDGAVNPKPFIPFGFLLRSHSAYRAATSSIMSGQLYESQALLRVCLEQAAYAHYIGGDQARYEIWMNRHDSKRAEKAVREEFSNGKVSRHLALTDVKLGQIYKKLYERTLDYGAHPNERGTSLSTKTTETGDGNKHFRTIYLHGDGLLLDFGLKCAAQVGLWVLRVAEDLYPHRMAALGIPPQLDDMFKRF